MFELPIPYGKTGNFSQNQTYSLGYFCSVRGKSIRGSSSLYTDKESLLLVHQPSSSQSSSSVWSLCVLSEVLLETEVWRGTETEEVLEGVSAYTRHEFGRAWEGVAHEELGWIEESNGGSE